MQLLDLNSATKLFQILKHSRLLMLSRALFFVIDFFFNFFLPVPPPLVPGSKKKILIHCFASLGDSVIFMSLAEDLKSLFPAESYELYWVCNDAFEKFYKDFFPNVFALPIYKMSFNLFGRFRIMRELRRERFDLVLDANGCEALTPNVFLTKSVAAAQKIGLYPGMLDNQDCRNGTPHKLAARVYTDIIRIAAPTHMSNTLLKYFEKVAGKSCTGRKTEFRQKRVEGLSEKYFVLCPCSAHVRNQWPLERYVALLEKLCAKYQLPAVLAGGSGDVAACAAIQQAVKAPSTVINLAGKTTLPELSWLLANSAFAVTLDSGAFHLAIALHVETFILAGLAHFRLYVQYEPQPEYLHIIADNCPQINCIHFCKYGNSCSYPCVERITLERAFREISAVLDTKKTGTN